MKKMLLLLSTLLLCACSNNAVSLSITDFYGEELQKVIDEHEGQLPVKLTYQESMMMYEDIEDKELIKKFYDALLGLKVGEQSNIDVTDSERNYWFTFEDGTTIFFMMYKADDIELIYNPKDKCNYNISDDNGLFNIRVEE